MQKTAQNSRIFYPEMGKMTYSQGAAYMLHPKNIPEQMQDLPDPDDAVLEDYMNLLQQSRPLVYLTKALH